MTLGVPVGRGRGSVCVCVCCEADLVCCWNQGKIITANWPEALASAPVTTARTHKKPAEESC